MAVAAKRAAAARRIVLLGPQRLAPTARTALTPLLRSGDGVAAVTAGWEEREKEHLELRDHLGVEVSNLELYARAESVFDSDRELHAALDEHHDKLHALQQLYRLRLRHLAPAAEQLLQREGPEDLLEPEREAAIEGLRALDRHHLERVTSIERDFERLWPVTDRPAVREHRRELHSLLAGCGALCIAGGHVRVLAARLRLFDLVSLLPERLPIVAWSAGAMALTERIVLFHDSPPQGAGYAEVLRPGLGLAPGLVALPHASRRLTLDDPVRVQLLARRFDDAFCAALDEGTQVAYDGRSWSALTPTRRLASDGSLVTMSAAERAPRLLRGRRK